MTEQDDLMIEMIVALVAAENALSDYVPTLERQGASMNYGRSVIRQLRAVLSKVALAK